MEVFNCPSMKSIPAICIALVVSAVAGEAPQAFEIALDPEADFVRDLRESTAAPVLGYAGSMIEYPDSMLQWLFVTNRAETAQMMKAAGARLVKEWNALDRWQAGLAYANAKDDAERAAVRRRFGREGLLADPKVWFSFRKENGMKVLLCLEQYRVWTDAAKGTTTNDVGIVRDTVRDYLKWIRDNGFADQVAGFELGNEPYWGKDPEEYGRRWCAIVPAMKEVWPDAQIGMPLAEYRPNDPDIAAVRARCEDMTWCKPAGEFKFSRLNQWSGRFIVAMKPVLDDITHVIYHFYGANAAYGCSAAGFHRIDNFAKVYPEIKDKKVWITEWRERADENNRIHQRFCAALWKAHYLLAVITRLDIDGVNNHCIASLAGGLYVSDGNRWRVQWDSANRDYLDATGVGRPHMELGPSGPLFRLYADALATHPIILNAGANGKQGLSPTALQHGRKEYPGVWDSALYYDKGTRSSQWVAATDPDRTSLAILFVNTRSAPAPFFLNLKGFRVSGEAVVEETAGTPYRGGNMSLPGEPKPWRESRRTAKAGKDGTFVCAMAPGSYAVVTIPLRRDGAAVSATPSDEAVAAAVADARAALPPFITPNQEAEARKTLIRIDPAGLKPDPAKASARARQFAKAGADAIGGTGAEKDLDRWVRAAVAYGPVPVGEFAGLYTEGLDAPVGFDAAADAACSREAFKYLALVSADRKYAVFLMVNSGDVPVKGEIAVTGFKIRGSMAEREARRGPDGHPLLDCREEKCGPNGEFVSSPHSFMTITLPLKK